MRPGLRVALAIGVGAPIACAARPYPPPEPPQVWVSPAAIRGEVPGQVEVWIPRDNLGGPRPIAPRR